MKTPKPRLLILFIFLLLIFTSVNPQGFLRSSGSKIIDGNGKEILLRGIGLGGWLVPEGYMLQTSSFANAGWQFRKKIEDLVGIPNADEFFKLYRANFVTRKDIQRIAEWGFNSIRLPMHFNLLTAQNTPYVYSEEGFAIIDSLLQWCEESRIYLILDLHAAPGGQSKENIADYNPAYLPLWEDPVAQQRTIELWKTIAVRYADKQWIGGYDLLNETAYNFSTGNNQPLRDLFISITNAIRQVDNNHIIFIEGNWYATDFNSLTPPWDNNMSYSFHKYWNGTDIKSIQYLINLRNSSNRPLWLGESGENSNTWFTDVIKLMESNNIGWSWWTLKKIDGINSLMSVTKPPEYDDLLNYWSGKTTTKPTVDFAMQALRKFAQSLNFDNCRQNFGVIDAMFREVTSTETIPFTDNSIPGIIFAPNYDYGQRGYAYSDVDYQNTGSGTWNSGGQYRNDGVDIEKCTDLISNGYDVGWISTGEFLNYSVDVKQSGIYDVEFRLTANTGDGKIAMMLDNQLLGNVIDVYATGGWSAWNSVNVKSISLPRGKHSLMLKFSNGGFNLNYINFVLISTNAADEKNIPDKFELSQNYPNPFNPNTNIKYQIPKAGFVTLKIYDSLGREITTLVNKEQQAGIYNYNFPTDSQIKSTLTSGVYFYRLNAGTFTLVKKMILMK